MADTNATTLRNALAAAIKNHVTTNGLKAKDAAEIAGVQYSRLSTILRGDVSKVSADALVNILGGFGYRVTGIVGSGDGTEIVLSLDKAEGQVLPEIEKPANPGETVGGFYVGGYVKEPKEGVCAVVSEGGHIEYSTEQTGVLHSYVNLTESPIDENCVVDPDAGHVVADDE